jgi:hypothetical protein
MTKLRRILRKSYTTATAGISHVHKDPLLLPFRNQNSFPTTTDKVYNSLKIHQTMQNINHINH